MNASLQAVLNLEVVRRKLTSLQPEHVMQKLITPAFGGLFLTALKNPGETFSPEAVQVVLADLSVKLPSLKLSQANHICHFLNPLLMSLSRCDVNTRVEIEEVSSCERCLINMWSKEEKYVFILPAPGENDSITSLWIRSEVEHEEAGQCVSCGLAVKKEFSMVLPEVLTLCVPQGVQSDSVANKPVTPCASLEFLMDESTTLSYRLASVICKGDFEGSVAHAWTCLFKNRDIVEADDDLISVVKSCRPDGICQGGIYYFYERSK
ncbi:hypothetical protein F2P81_009299 [Scophthalmus maximus]|uniref:Uncharacterized protein n=1 Tax=Scophthalmus maximus TaxID=52904 RepID=A0A6A4T180_SCOMX|nr:hypothetical protein F2P81_009299 [Scophthalmus maximus]